jgi:hypothetical protein
VKLTYWYWPATDLSAGVAFHRDQLGFLEAWREGSETVAFWLPDRVAQVMVSTTNQPAGPMYLVDDVGEWLVQHPDVVVGVERYDIPGGSVVGLTGPDSNVFYVFDQPNAQ